MEKIRNALDRARRERNELGAAIEVLDRVATDTEAAVGEIAVAAHDACPVVTRARSFQPDPLHLEHHRVLRAGQVGAVADAFRLLRTQVLDRMRERGWRALGVVSPRSRDGKSTVAANLTIAVAADPRHTAMLVDLDLRRPGTATLFGLPAHTGVEAVLQGTAELDACIVHPVGFDGVRLLPAGATVTGSAELASSVRCRALVTELRERYENRIVVFDLPPVLECDDALLIAPLLDCVLMVVAEGATSRDDVARSLELLRRVPVVGTVLNRSVTTPRRAAAD